MLKRILLMAALLAVLGPARSVRGQWVVSQDFWGCGRWACVRYSYLVVPYVGHPNVFIDADPRFFYPDDAMTGLVVGFDGRMPPIWGYNGIFADYGPDPGATADSRLPRRIPITVVYGPWDVWWDGANHVAEETFWLLDVTSVATPEPATLLLLGTGLAGIAGAARRRRKRGRSPGPP